MIEESTRVPPPPVDDPHSLHTFFDRAIAQQDARADVDADLSEFATGTLDVGLDRLLGGLHLGGDLLDRPTGCVQDERALLLATETRIG